VIYESKAISVEDFAWVTVRFRLLFEEGWEQLKNPKTGKPHVLDGVVYLRRLRG
jgi:hypothetical protein